MTHRGPLAWLILSLASGLIAAPAAAAPDAVNGLSVAGWIERVWLQEDGKRVSVRAKLDTGAKSSSINAPQYREFKRGGKTWLSFAVTNNKGQTIEIEAPLLRIARIRRAGVKVRERPVVELGICVGGHHGVTEFTLADRSDLNYPVLIGRRFLKDRILVDSGRSFSASGLCK